MPEAFVSSAELAVAVSREVKAGRLRKLGSRLYARNLKDPAEKIMQRNLEPACSSHGLPGQDCRNPFGDRHTRDALG